MADGMIAGIRLDTDLDMPPGVMEMRSGDSRLRMVLRDAAEGDAVAALQG